MRRLNPGLGEGALLDPGLGEGALLRGVGSLKNLIVLPVGVGGVEQAGIPDNKKTPQKKRRESESDS